MTIAAGEAGASVVGPTDVPANVGITYSITGGPPESAQQTVSYSASSTPSLYSTLYWGIAGVAASMNNTLNYIGVPTNGTFNITGSTATWTGTTTFGGTTPVNVEFVATLGGSATWLTSLPSGVTDPNQPLNAVAQITGAYSVTEQFLASTGGAYQPFTQV
jgi:hypothetical protein